MVRSVLMRRAILAVNESCYHLHVLNGADITDRVIETGLFQRKKIEKTLSDAINIEVASTIIKFLQTAGDR